MDPRVLATVLADTFSDNNAARENAAAQLQQAESKDGYYSALLQVIAQPEADLDTRYAAVLRLKNLLKDHWRIVPEKEQVIGDGDRKFIVEHIVEAVVSQEQEDICTLMLASMAFVVKYDFPGNVSLDSVLAMFATVDTGRIINALRIVVMICRQFRYGKHKISPNQQHASNGEMRDALAASLLKAPVLGALFDSVYRVVKAQEFESPEGAERAYKILYLICKAFTWMCHISIPQCLRDEKVISDWIDRLLLVLELPFMDGYFDALPSSDDRELRYLMLMKAKKRSARMLTKVMEDMLPDQVDEAEKAFGEFLYEKTAARLTTCTLALLYGNYERKFPLYSKLLHAMYDILAVSVNYSQLWKIMKPDIAKLLCGCVLFNGALTSEDLDLWHSNPAQYTIDSQDLEQQFDSAQGVAILFATSAVRKRTATTLPVVLEHIQSVLDKFASQQPSVETAIEKEVALHLFGSLSNMLRTHDELKVACATVLREHVLQDAISPQFGFLQMRAVWALGKFSRLETEDEELPFDCFNACKQALCESKEFPVKQEAGTSLWRFCKLEKLGPLIKPHVGEVLGSMFQLLDYVMNENVVLTLGSLLEVMGADVAEFAEEVCAKLIAVYLECLTRPESDDSASMTAVQTMQAVNTVLVCVKDQKELFSKLEPIFTPAMHAMVTQEASESLDELLRCVNCFAFFGPTISQGLWEMIPRMHYAHFNLAGDQICELYPVFDTYLYKGGDVVVASQDKSKFEHNYLEMMLEVAFDILEQTDREIDATYATLILEKVAVHIGKFIPDIMPSLILRVSETLTTAMMQTLQKTCAGTLSVMAWVNPTLLFQTLSSEGDETLKSVLNHWLTALPLMRGDRVHLKKFILGVSACLTLNIAELPESVQRGFPNFLGNSLQAAVWSSTADEDKKQLDLERYGDEAEMDPDFVSQWGEDVALGDFDQDFEDWDDEQDVEDFQGGIGDFSSAFNRQFDEENEGKQEFMSALDNYDEYVYFAQCLETCKANNQQVVAQWEQTLGDSADALHMVLQEATQRFENEGKRQE